MFLDFVFLPVEYFIPSFGGLCGYLLVVANTVGSLVVASPSQIRLHGCLAGSMCFVFHDTFFAHDARGRKSFAFAKHDGIVVGFLVLDYLMLLSQ